MLHTAKLCTDTASIIKRPKRLAFIITGLATGGAEMMLYKLLSHMNREQFEPVVVSLTERGKLGDRIASLDIPVHTIGMKAGISTLASIWRLVHIVRQLKPDLIQGWMYHGNLAAQIVAALACPKVPVLWNIRGSRYILKNEKPSTAATIWLGAKLSNFPVKILNNSQASATGHEFIGYCAEKSFVIPNGFDRELFAPSMEHRRSVRYELKIRDNSILIGLIGRYDPLKDHVNFIQGAALLIESYPGVKFLLAGQGVDWQNPILCKLIEQLELTKRIYLLGERHDIPRLTAALDIATSSSYSEGFPNVIGEAMSCGVPCVVTDVGDSRWIVGETGRVVTTRNPEALAKAWQDLIELGQEGRERLGKAARERIKDKFSIESVVQQYEQVYTEVIYGRQH